MSMSMVIAAIDTLRVGSGDGGAGARLTMTEYIFFVGKTNPLEPWYEWRPVPEQRTTKGGVQRCSSSLPRRTRSSCWCCESNKALYLLGLAGGVYANIPRHCRADTRGKQGTRPQIKREPEKRARLLRRDAK